MITSPDRLEDLVAAIEAGEPVDLNKVAQLQALDIARAGRQFVEAAIISQEQADDRFAEFR